MLGSESPLRSARFEREERRRVSFRAERREGMERREKRERERTGIVVVVGDGCNRVSTRGANKKAR